MTRMLRLIALLAIVLPSRVLAQSPVWDAWWARTNQETHDSIDHMTAIIEVSGPLLTAMELYWQKAPDDALYFAKAARDAFQQHRDRFKDCWSVEEVPAALDRFVTSIEQRKGVATVDEAFSVARRFLFDRCGNFSGSDSLAITSVRMITNMRQAYREAVQNGAVTDPHRYQMGYGYMQALNREARVYTGPSSPSEVDMDYETIQAIETLLPLWTSLTTKAAPDADSLFEQSLQRIENAYRAFTAD